jgi:hypothetical protein
MRADSGGRVPVSDRGTLGGLTQFAIFRPSGGRNLLIQNGEMAEWSMAHAWKSNRVRITEQH